MGRSVTQGEISQAERMSRNWHLRGAWDDSFWCEFEDGFVFPDGTNHLSGVEVLSRGELWRTPFDTNAVASLGAAVSIVPGATGFSCGPTTSNSYLFAWSGAYAGRVPKGQLASAVVVDAAIELFRNGDIAVTTNGVTQLVPRPLPFPHDGFGQDGEWVAANFTNASEILSVGYPQWVDSQVGHGLTNGLYKLTATLSEDPPETAFVSVGALSVAATNAGDYVFLLEKGVGYDLDIFPPGAGFVIFADDDVPASRSLSAARTTGLARSAQADGVWTVAAGEFWTDYVPWNRHARCLWLPSLCGSPDVSHLWPADGGIDFSAVLADCCNTNAVTFEWSAGEGLAVASPGSQTTEVSAEGSPSWRETFLAVTAWFCGDASLSSRLSLVCGTELAPQSGITLSAPKTVIANDDDDNNDGVVDSEAIDFEDMDVASGGVTFRSDVVTNGTIRIYASGGTGGCVYTNENADSALWGVAEFPVADEMFKTIPLRFCFAHASSYPGPELVAEWVPADGNAVTSTASVVAVEPIAEAVCCATKTVSTSGTNRVYTINPCGVAVGDDAYFRIEVFPESFPDSDIVWTNRNGGLDITGSGTGREVRVRGVSEGVSELSAIIGGCEWAAPTFEVHVVAPTTVCLRAWIITGENCESAHSPESVRQMVEEANDIYSQVGVRFELVEPITITNIPAAYNALYNEPTNATDMWSFDMIVDIASGTGGLECYFINKFVDDDVCAVNSAYGAVFTAAASGRTLAHEIGHAFGMRDIYLSSRESDEQAPEIQIGLDELICWNRMIDDWNGGCRGRGPGGARYYGYWAPMRRIVPRMLMYGAGASDDDNRRDITAGDIYGVWYQREQNNAKVWRKDDAPVGFPWHNRNPVHE